MSKRDILKLILVTSIVVCVMVLILLVFSKKYLEDNITVAKNNTVETTIDSENLHSPIIDAVITEMPEPIEEPKEIKKIEYNLTPGKYYIKVNNEMNTVTVYIKDDNGDYTIPVKAMICSTGEATPQNSKYIIGGKRWIWRLLFGNVYGQYTTHINNNILFHSVPYIKEAKNTLEYWEYDKLGTEASLGCIRLKVEDAKWIYENCLAGSIVEFYSDSNPGPLGKPTAMKISEYEEYRNWDPTDSDEKNPWKNFEGERY